MSEIRSQTSEISREFACFAAAFFSAGVVGDGFGYVERGILAAHIVGARSFRHRDTLGRYFFRAVVTRIDA